MFHIFVIHLFGMQVFAHDELYILHIFQNTFLVCLKTALHLLFISYL
jgi:hypothetical protein